MIGSLIFPLHTQHVTIDSISLDFLFWQGAGGRGQGAGGRGQVFLEERKGKKKKEIEKWIPQFPNRIPNSPNPPIPQSLSPRRHCSE